MAKDTTNIFKLSELEQEKYNKAPFFDCMPGAEDFAEALKQDILIKDTPHVLLLEKHYGMGKTFFCTRFTKYLRNNNIYTIYFSAWENDYLQDPFLSFSKELIKYFKADKPIKEKITKTIAFPLEALISVVKACSINFSAVGVPIDIDASKIFEQFQADIDPIQEFKKEFRKFIKQLKRKKLVLIVDELDRCRPDYAMKVLEIIKHFFDIEGLFIIVPTNQEALDVSLEALYGIKNKQNSNSENYFRKFFNNALSIPEPNYVKLAQEKIKIESLSKAIELGHVREEDDYYNSYNTLIMSVAHYGKNASLTLREMTYICSEIIHICNNFTEEVRAEYLSYMLCNKTKKKKGDINSYNAQQGIALNSTHPYYCDRHGDFPNSTKRNVLNLSSYIEIYNKNKQVLANFYYNHQGSYAEAKLITQLSNQINAIDINTLQTYADISNFIIREQKNINECRNAINGINLPYNAQTLPQILDNFLNTLELKKQEIINFKKKYGSDDKDQQRMLRYKEIVEKPETLYDKVSE